MSRQANLPKKLKKVTLGVLDPKLGGAIAEEIGVKVGISTVLAVNLIVC